MNVTSVTSTVNSSTTRRLLIVNQHTFCWTTTLSHFTNGHRQAYTYDQIHRKLLTAMVSSMMTFLNLSNIASVMSTVSRSTTRRHLIVSQRTLRRTTKHSQFTNGQRQARTYDQTHRKQCGQGVIHDDFSQSSKRFSFMLQTWRYYFISDLYSYCFVSYALSRVWYLFYRLQLKKCWIMSATAENYENFPKQTTNYNLRHTQASIVR